MVTRRQHETVENELFKMEREGRLKRAGWDHASGSWRWTFTDRGRELAMQELRED
jgi:hypothetical protein